MSFMVEKDNRGGICHAMHQYAPTNNKYMKNYSKNKESTYLMYLDVNNLYMSQKSPVNGLECINNTAEFNEEFINNYYKDSKDN